MEMMYVLKRSKVCGTQESALEFHEDLLAFSDWWYIPKTSEDEYYVYVPYTETGKLLAAFKELLGEVEEVEKAEPLLKAYDKDGPVKDEERKKNFVELVEKYNLEELMVYVREFYRTRDTYDLEAFVSQHPEIKSSWYAHYDTYDDE